MKKIAITGANGFIGKSLCKTFSKLNRSFVRIVRSENSLKTLNGINTIFVGDINSNTNWSQSLENCEVIIHCAGKVHVMDNKDNDNHLSDRITDSLPILDRCCLIY